MEDLSLRSIEIKINKLIEDPKLDIINIKLDDIGLKVNDSHSRLVEFKNNIVNIEAKVLSIDTVSVENKNKLNEVNSNVVNTQAKVNDVSTKVTDIQTKVNSTKTAIDEIDGKLNTIVTNTGGGVRAIHRITNTITVSLNNQIPYEGRSDFFRYTNLPANAPIVSGITNPSKCVVRLLPIKQLGDTMDFNSLYMGYIDNDKKLIILGTFSFNQPSNYNTFIGFYEIVEYY